MSIQEKPSKSEIVKTCREYIQNQDIIARCEEVSIGLREHLITEYEELTGDGLSLVRGELKVGGDSTKHYYIKMSGFVIEDCTWDTVIIDPTIKQFSENNYKKK